VAELKREAQHAVSMSRSRGLSAAVAASAQSRGVRVVRDGQIVQKERADKRGAEITEPEEEQYVASESREIAVGDRVRLRSFGSIGIVDNIKDDQAEVRVKSLRFREKLENLELVESVASPKAEVGRFAKLRAAPGTEVHLSGRDENARAELKVIGQNTEEAVGAVDKFLDEAFINSLSQVRIVHGHGTGALRRAIAELLQNHPHVERFSLAPPEQGGAGATIVELRQ
jgi:DNA mismatch repair protein MutS2